MLKKYLVVLSNSDKYENLSRIRQFKGNKLKKKRYLVEK